MNFGIRRLCLAGLIAGLLAACGGGGGTPTDLAPQVTIETPLDAATFIAGDKVEFNGSATDREDGRLEQTALAWWADLHVGDQTHPAQPETEGSRGRLTIPTRGETSAAIFYRFHLRATDSAGHVTEVTRDILPTTSQLSFATVPAGLPLTLEGQTQSTPATVASVVGMERDLGAEDQNFNGRRYRFVRWSDGGNSTHTVTTPATDSSYTATYTDIGAANEPPVVALVGTPATGIRGTPITLAATASDSDGSVAKVIFLDGATRIGEDTSSPYGVVWTPGSAGVHSLRARAVDNLGLGTSSSAVAVTVSEPIGGDSLPPVATLTAPADLAGALAGTLTLSASAVDNFGVTGIEIQLDGVQVGAIGTTSSHTVTVDSNAYASGQHVVRAQARDAAGNLSPWASATVRFAGTRALPAGFTANESWLTGLNFATAFVQAPDGRFFVAQQSGRVQVVKNAALLADSMLRLDVDATGERGLIGIALHPDFANNGYLYVHYTTAEGGVHNRISRFSVNGDLAGNELKLVELPSLSSATNHNGGALHFGADGKLYVAVGDNANSANAQKLDSVFGKMLRFNADGTIPSDNPFYASQTGLARAIWAYGLRNPYTFAFQPGTGRMHINDVGQDTWEEIDLGEAGANYGWPASEGPDGLSDAYTAPLFSYKHSAATPTGSGPGGFFVGIAIAGGTFYPDSGPFPASFRGSYFFADYVRGFVGRYDWANDAAYAFATVAGRPVDLLVGSDGALYLLVRDSITRFSAP